LTPVALTTTFCVPVLAPEPILYSTVRVELEPAASELIEALGLKPPEGEEKKKVLSGLSPQELSVIDLLNEPIPRDELIRTLGLPIQEANSLLSIMEIKNLIKEELGKICLA